MAITKTEDHLSNTDRYRFDFGLCRVRDGWAQVDTEQDASYYGTWANPLTREIQTYAEGDSVRVKCETDAEFIQELRALITWHKENEYFIGIDGMCNAVIIEALTRLGFADDLH